MTLNLYQKYSLVKFSASLPWHPCTDIENQKGIIEGNFNSMNGDSCAKNFVAVKNYANDLSS